MAEINASEYREKGYLLLKQCFPKEGVERVRQDAKQVFLTQMVRHGLVPSSNVPERTFEDRLYEYFKQHLEEYTNCAKQTQHLLSLHRMSLDPRLEHVLMQLGLPVPNIGQRPVLFFNSIHLAKRESYWRTPPHQDWRSMQGSLDAVVAWIPLVDVDISLGALQVVPGSHKLGLLAGDYIDDFGIVEQFGDEDFISVEMEQGDALFFSAFLVHRSGTNSTESIRWSAQFRYNNLDEPTFIQRGYPHPYLYKPQQDLVTPEFFPGEELLSQLFK